MEKTYFTHILLAIIIIIIIIIIVVPIHIHIKSRNEVMTSACVRDPLRKSMTDIGLVMSELGTDRTLSVIGLDFFLPRCYYYYYIIHYDKDEMHTRLNDNS